jgi:ferric-dicitrate binding protein FerR (iron transport regulator)
MAVKCRSSVLIYLFLALVTLVGCESDTASDIKATVLALTGKVEVRANSSSSFVVARVNDIFGDGGAIRTAKESLADFAIKGRGMVKLRPDTYFELNSGNSSVSQNTGTAIYEIDKGNDAFKIKSPQCFTCVLGTRFMVQVLDNMTVVGVEEGRVEVIANNGKSKTLEAKQKLSVADSGFIDEPVPFDMFDESFNYIKVNDSWVSDD